MYLSQSECRDLFVEALKKESNETKGRLLTDFLEVQPDFKRNTAWSYSILGQYGYGNKFDHIEHYALNWFYNRCIEGDVYMRLYKTDEFARPDKDIEGNQKIIEDALSDDFEVCVNNGTNGVTDGFILPKKDFLIKELPADLDNLDREPNMLRFNGREAIQLEIGYNNVSKTVGNLLKFGTIARLPYANSWRCVRGVTILALRDYHKWIPTPYEWLHGTEENTVECERCGFNTVIGEAKESVNGVGDKIYYHHQCYKKIQKEVSQWSSFLSV